MTGYYDVEGETSEGQLIEQTFFCSFEEVVHWCKSTLVSMHGGQIDIFNEDGRFVCSVIV